MNASYVQHALLGYIYMQATMIEKSALMGYYGKVSKTVTRVWETWMQMLVACEASKIKIKGK